MGRIRRDETEGDVMLSFNDVSVALGDGAAVVKETQVEVGPGERVLVAGESGSGKSTLVRANRRPLAPGRRSVDFHPHHQMFILLQLPYIPSGTLRRAVAYPEAGERKRLDRRWTGLASVI